jgi:hypothetical protein
LDFLVAELKAKILRALRLSDLITVDVDGNDEAEEYGYDDDDDEVAEAEEDDGSTDPSLLSQHSQQRRRGTQHFI